MEKGRRRDVDRVDLGIRQHRIVRRVELADAEFAGNRLRAGLVQIADRNDLRIWVRKIALDVGVTDQPESDEPNPYFVHLHRCSFHFWGVCRGAGLKSVDVATHTTLTARSNRKTAMPSSRLQSRAKRARCLTPRH